MIRWSSWRAPLLVASASHLTVESWWWALAFAVVVLLIPARRRDTVRG